MSDISLRQISGITAECLQFNFVSDVVPLHYLLGQRSDAVTAPARQSHPSSQMATILAAGS